MQRSKSLAMMFLLGTLVVGGALGFSADRWFARAPLCRASSDSSVSWKDRFAAELQLTSGQRVALDSILDKRHRDISAIYATVRPQTDSVKQRARADFMKLLNPDQQQRFQHLIHESHSNSAREEKTKK